MLVPPVQAIRSNVFSSSREVSGETPTPYNAVVWRNVAETGFPGGPRLWSECLLTFIVRTAIRLEKL